MADAISCVDLVTLFSRTNSIIEPLTNPLRSVSSYSGGSIRLDIIALDAVVYKLFSRGLAISTLRSYRSCVNRYTQFCMRGGFSLLYTDSDGPWQPSHV